MNPMFRAALAAGFLLPAFGSFAGAQDLSLATVLIDGENWQLVADGYQFTEGPAVDQEGQVYFSDIPASRIYKIDLEGKVSLFADATANTNGLMFGPDGLLYGCRNGEKQIATYDSQAKVQIVADEVSSNDLVVLGDGGLYFSDPTGGRVWYVSPEHKKRIVAEGLRPNGVILWPDQGTLVITEAIEPVLWTFRVEPDGSLTGKDRYYGPLQMLPGSERTGADGMTVDAVGRLYVTTRVGLQMFDPIGRLGGTIARPHSGPLANVCFGGPNLDTLYVTAGDKVFKRRTQARGVRYAKTKANSP
ncbi:MAG: SMP-30/gluconolactonase/LRE family protein [Planctomycetaceae bacterium]|nr:SMP-30/gluconolactonase/LRE family protein [Planctomycetaceae bacterium]